MFWVESLPPYGIKHTLCLQASSTIFTTSSWQPVQSTTHMIAYYRGTAMSRVYQWKGHNETFLLIVWEVGDKVGGQRKMEEFHLSSFSVGGIKAFHLLPIRVSVSAHPEYMWRKGTSHTAPTAWTHPNFSPALLLLIHLIHIKEKGMNFRSAGHPKLLKVRPII